MGHGYFAVFGWGAVIPLDLFVEVYPETFTQSVGRDDEIIYSPNYQELEHLAEINDISLFYEEQAAPTNIFICSKEHYQLDARGAGGSFEIVNFDHLNQHLQELRIFIAENFPEVTVVNPMLYAYEGS